MEVLKQYSIIPGCYVHKSLTVQSVKNSKGKTRRGLFTTSKHEPGEVLIRISKKATLEADTVAGIGAALEAHEGVYKTAIWNEKGGLPIWKKEEKEKARGSITLDFVFDENNLRLKGDTLRAAGVALSRAFRLNDNKQYVLIPVVDFINHSDRNFNVFLEETCSHISVRTFLPVVNSGKSEILLSYGPLSPPQLLHDYGIPPVSSHHAIHHSAAPLLCPPSLIFSSQPYPALSSREVSVVPYPYPLGLFKKGAKDDVVKAIGKTKKVIAERMKSVPKHRVTARRLLASEAVGLRKLEKKIESSL
eukprot:TRINITY_DN13507_c2_g1_i1.p1 TRINITY_DN13507_c2_g1~~TRINITY_DN13507_c2_g1_i1.p1  ORF type:complete len:304 (+),score=30.57 TRINITY_DN13507_c2_g1_i1:70-981(+)